MVISPQDNEKTVFYTGKLYGLTGMCSFAYIWDWLYFAAQHSVAKDSVENPDFFFFFLHSDDDSSEPVPFSSSEPFECRPPTQEGKQKSQASVSTSERPRFNQALVKNVDCKAQGYCAVFSSHSCMQVLKSVCNPCTWKFTWKENVRKIWSLYSFLNKGIWDE